MRSWGPKRWAALIAVLVLALGALFTVAWPAVSDERDDLAAAQEQADKDRAALRNSLSGIDAEIADAIVRLSDLNAQLPVLRKELEDAQDAAEAARRDHAQLTDRLTQARAEKDSITQEIAAGEERIEQDRAVLADLAKRAYRGELSTSPLEIALTATTPQEFADKAVAADVITRSRLRSVDAVSAEVTQNESRENRQELVSGQVADLEQQAAAALADAEDKEAVAAQKLQEVETAQAEQAALNTQLNGQKSTIEAQLAEADQAYEQRAARIAQLDAEEAAAAAAAAAAQNNAAPPASGGAGTGGSGGTGGYGGSGLFRYPVDGNPEVTSGYGWRIHPILGYPKFHDGVDLGSPCGQPVYAIEAGTTFDVYYDTGGGNMVYIHHGNIGGNNYNSGYLHLQSSTVGGGQYVNRGDLIGYVGTTGRSSGCHLHFEIWKNGATTDPLGYY
ncbi:peptidoglycan DD-metalloendopeptidase family protein [Buchananella felis]|uniref:peptidoglycan DD-metalloendopeptidase family protein n=1 Tax=Buchananella felis TaxID=3231492 RepID=UPI0035288E37